MVGVFNPCGWRRLKKQKYKAYNILIYNYLQTIRILFFTYKTDVLHEKGEKGIIIDYIIYSCYIYARARSCTLTTTQRQTFSPCLVVPSFLFPLIFPHGRNLVHSPPSVKFSFRRARRSDYFAPFCRLLSCLPYSLHAAVSARRYTQRKRAYLRSCAPCLSSSVSIFYTLKKSFTF